MRRVLVPLLLGWLTIARAEDVIVYGATPSGILAAVAAKREGASVLLVEPSRWVGGILGAGIKPHQDCPRPEAVGGLAREVVDKGGRSPVETRAYFQALLAKHEVTVLYEHRVARVEKEGAKIVRLILEKAPPDAWGIPVADAVAGSERAVEARVFIDASYEGDLLARAGVKFSIGREPRTANHEAHAGVGKWTNLTPISPHLTPGDPASGLLPLVEADHGKAKGEGDDYTQAYNFRYYITTDPAKRAALTPPDGYDARDFELVGRYVEHALKAGRPPLDKLFPGHLDRNGEYNYFRESLITMTPLGLSRPYQDAGYAERVRLWRAHVDYLRGLHHFLSTDPRVPEDFRQATAEIGLDRTHHPDTAGWPHQLYVRVARRLAGRYTLTEHDVLNRTRVEDSVGLALYGVDIYPVRRVAVQDERGQWAVATEGNMFIGGESGTGKPFGVPYRALTPRVEEATNLLVPVCLSATHVAYAAARMEPVFMVLGESAGVAAAQAVREKQSVQDIDVPALQKRLRALGQIVEWPPKESSPPR